MLFLCHEHNIWLPSILPPSDIKSLTHCVSAQACFSGGWLLRAIFRSLSLPPSTLFSLSSSPLLCPSLYYSAEGSSHLRNAPVHTGIIEDSWCTSASTCTHVCVLKIEKGQRLD